ncbi:hypothetical protein Syun_014747 [Stephania yunnanensis]|uniref:Uncharacterized protein n=1 Tax=Stephania yunnanensis TaxID=152371 RepID=A0AAP0JK41_9MAGN
MLLEKTKLHLPKWRKRQPIANSDHQVKALEEQLQRAHNDSDPDWLSIRQIEFQLNQAINLEEEYWRVRSLVDWLARGDKNMSYFHAKVKQQRRSNKILQLRDDRGAWITKQFEIFKLVENYFDSIFTSQPSHMSTQNLPLIQRRLLAEEIAQLIRPISDKEIKEATFSIHPTKCPGPDSFSAKFLS